MFRWKRKELFKFRVANGLTDYSEGQFSEWNNQFKSEHDEFHQEYLYDDMQRLKGKDMDSFGCCACTPTSENDLPTYNRYNEEQGDNPMRTESIKSSASIQFTNEDAQRGYLLGRLNETYYAKLDEARKIYRLDEPDGPKTIKELKAFLAAGNIILKTRADGTSYQDDYNFADEYRQSRHFISFRKAGEEADPKGFEAFETKLSKDKKKVEDIITVKSLDTGYEAFEKFEETPVA